MEDWKVRQEIYHRLNTEHPDQYGQDDIQMMQFTDVATITATVSRYMAGWIPEKVIYPAKSYFVAIVYARLLRDYFDVNPLRVLNDPDLLHNNDPYFVPYEKDITIYDAILNVYTWDFDITKGEIPDVANYFYQEFQISPNCVKGLSSQ